MDNSTHFAPGFPDPIPEPETIQIHPGWANSPVQVARHLEAFRTILQEIGWRQAPSGFGRGVVICGGGKYWPGMVLAVRMLREVGSDLPVELWHRGTDEPVFPEDIEGLGDVSIIDATKVGTTRILRGWEAKSHALIHTRFETILYLDADAYTVANPVPLLDLAERHGFIFWEDLPNTQKNVRWETVWPSGAGGVPPIQGGQLALHRPTLWPEILGSHWLNQHSDFYYQHFFGDQDAWRVIFAATGKKIHNLGNAPWRETAFVCPLGEAPLIVHRCQGKMFRPEDIPPGNQAYSNPKYALPMEAKAFDHFAEILKKERDPEKIFSQVYAKRLWGDGSGTGSAGEEALGYIRIVNTLIGFGGIQSVVDAGAGDGFIGSRLKVPRYTGLDCSQSVAQAAQARFPKLDIIHMDFYRDREQMPPGDLLLTKDVLHHWPNDMVTDWLGWAIRAGKWKRILLTQDKDQIHEGQNCHLGGYRALNPSMEPLRSFPLVPLTDYLHKSILMVECP